MQIVSKVTDWLGDPMVLRRTHAILTFTWLVTWAVAWFTGWIYQVAFVSHLSVIALVLTSWGAWQSARVEVHQKLDNDVREVIQGLQEIATHLGIELNEKPADTEKEIEERKA